MSKAKEKTYTTGQAARLIGVSFRTIKRWIYSGKISAYKTTSGRYRVQESEIDRFKKLMSSELEKLAKDGRGFKGSLEEESGIFT